MRNPWFDLSMSMMKLGFDAQQVIALRTVKLMAGGPAADTEANLMVAEKMQAAADAGLTMTVGLMSGRSQADIAREVVGAYRRKTSANRRRLSR